MADETTQALVVIHVISAAQDSNLHISVNITVAVDGSENCWLGWVILNWRFNCVADYGFRWLSYEK